MDIGIIIYNIKWIIPTHVFEIDAHAANNNAIVRIKKLLESIGVVKFRYTDIQNRIDIHHLYVTLEAHPINNR